MVADGTRYCDKNTKMKCCAIYTFTESSKDTPTITLK